jgi:hypothetical protein
MDVNATVKKLRKRGVRAHCLALGGVVLRSSSGRMTMSVLTAVATPAWHRVTYQPQHEQGVNRLSSHEYLILVFNGLDAAETFSKLQNRPEDSHISVRCDNRFTALSTASGDKADEPLSRFLPCCLDRILATKSQVRRPSSSSVNRSSATRSYRAAFLCRACRRKLIVTLSRHARVLTCRWSNFDGTRSWSVSAETFARARGGIMGRARGHTLAIC